MRRHALLPLPLLGLLGACQQGRGMLPDDGEVFDLSRPRRDLSMARTEERDLRAPDVHVVMTADNAYAFGWGDGDRVTSLRGRPRTETAADIFNCPVGRGPEAYDVPAEEVPLGAYLYVIAWADDATTQGLVGQVSRGGPPVYTGSGDWQVCATGIDHDPGASGSGPAIEVVNEEIARCNGAAGDPARSSVGWVTSSGALSPGAVGKLVVGEENNARDGNFPIVCQKDDTGNQGVDAAARWIWYSPDGRNPFVYGGGKNPTRDFLIFRLPAQILG